METYYELKVRHRRELLQWQTENKKGNIDNWKEQGEKCMVILNNNREIEFSKKLAYMLNRLNVKEKRKEILGYNYYRSLIALLPELITITLQISYIPNSSGSKMKGKIIFQRVPDNTPAINTDYTVIIRPVS